MLFVKLDSKVCAVLGASDETNCSYDKGYVYRQALYGCITCLNEKRKSCATKEEEIDALHGICLACSYECHQNHELYELYTKRYFKCDCGNSKFTVDGKAQPCKLRDGKEEKDPINSLNKYNHNFNGLYCTCNTPYPDESNQADTSANNDLNNSSTASKTANADAEDVSDDMIQCTVCEDWFHCNHLEGFEDLESSLDEDRKTDELVCHLCMEKLEFLREYQGYILKKVKEANDQNTNVDVVNTEVGADEAKLGEFECLLEKQRVLNQGVEKSKGTCIFLEGWRDALCKCAKCLDLCEFLLVLLYEK